MTYKDYMEEMLEAFGARAKYEALTARSYDNDLGKDIYDYKSSLVNFATELDKTDPIPPSKYSGVTFTRRDRLMMIWGAQDNLEWAPLYGAPSVEKYWKKMMDASNRNCFPRDLVLYG